MWYLPALCCALFWGLAYSVLNNIATDINQFTVNITYYAFSTIVNFLALVWTQQVDNFFLFADPPSNALYILLYTILCTASSMLSMYGFLEASKMHVSSAFVAISSCYPIVNFIISYGFMNQRNVDLRFAITGISLTTLGIILLVVSKK